LVCFCSSPLTSSQAAVDDTSSEEVQEVQVHQENLSLEIPENLGETINTLANLPDLQEPIVSTSAVIPVQEKVYYTSRCLHFPFPCDILIFACFSGFQPLRIAVIRPSVRWFGYS